MPVGAENLDWRIHTKSKSGDHTWFVNNDNIANIDIFRIHIGTLHNKVITYTVEDPGLFKITQSEFWLHLLFHLVQLCRTSSCSHPLPTYLSHTVILHHSTLIISQNHCVQKGSVSLICVKLSQFLSLDHIIPQISFITHLSGMGLFDFIYYIILPGHPISKNNSYE